MAIRRVTGAVSPSELIFADANALGATYDGSGTTIERGETFTLPAGGTTAVSNGALRLEALKGDCTITNNGNSTLTNASGIDGTIVMRSGATEFPAYVKNSSMSSMEVPARESFTGSLTGSIGTLNRDITFPAGHVIQVNQTFTQASVTRSGNKTAWANTYYKCDLPNNLKSNSKLYCTFSSVYGEQEGGHWSSVSCFTFYQNSMNILGNQLNFGEYVGSANDKYGGGKPVDANRGLASANLFSNSQYQRSQVYMTALFTPTGSDAAKKEVQVWWRSVSTSSYEHVLGQGMHSTGMGWQRQGTTVVTMMEIAG